MARRNPQGESRTTMTIVTIYHNPRCRTSRIALALLRKTGLEPKIVEYLKTPPGKTELARLLKLMGKSPRELLRPKEAKAVGLTKPGLSDAALIEGMVKHPIAIERPIVVKGNRAVPARPPEAVLKLL
jgi:arsenate reductase (glutaredoxin)